MPGSPTPYIRQASAHQRLAYSGGAELAVILDATITGGQLTVIDSHGRRGDASPVHVHGNDDEAFLLLDGEMTVWAATSAGSSNQAGSSFYLATSRTPSAATLPAGCWCCPPRRASRSACSARQAGT